MKSNHKKSEKSPSSRELTSAKFGSVTIQVKPPTTAEIDRNIRAGQFALRRARHKIISPGVEFKVDRGIPLYSVDPQNPDILIRKLNGKKEKVRFKNGRLELCR